MPNLGTACVRVSDADRCALSWMTTDTSWAKGIAWGGPAFTRLTRPHRTPTPLGAEQPPFPRIRSVLHIHPPPLSPYEHSFASPAYLDPPLLFQNQKAGGYIFQ